MFNSELWRAYFREISREGPILSPKTIRQQPVRDSHSINMDYRLALKGELTLLLIDGAKRSEVASSDSLMSRQCCPQFVGHEKQNDHALALHMASELHADMSQRNSSIGMCRAC
jgi:hypothetical protein